MGASNSRFCGVLIPRLYSLIWCKEDGELKVTATAPRLSQGGIHADLELLQP